MKQITVVDFGGQYAHLIKRRVRDLGVNAEIVASENFNFKESEAKGIILSGGPKSVTELNAPTCDIGVFTQETTPVLGICYGHQLMAKALGGKIETGKDGEYGPTKVHVMRQEPIFSGLENTVEVLMSHGDSVAKVPEGFEITSITENSRISSMQSVPPRLCGVQFHPEVDDTPKGNEILWNFVNEIAKCEKDWTLDSYIQESLDNIDKTVKGRDIIMFASGGVDSTVAATLLGKAKKEGRSVGRIHVVHIDNGLMRLNESRTVVGYLCKLAGLEDITLEDASEYFLEQLKGATEPEDKRKRIGNAFGYVQQQVADRLKLASDTMLCQGTLYTDTIESGKGVGNKAAKIKTHHNVGCKFIEDKKKAGLLVEPNSDWYKDQVRKIGRQLGLPAEYVDRQPFPGPGLGIRIVDQEVTREKCDLLRKAEAIYEEEINKSGIGREIKQYFAALLSTRAVGVMGDERTYLPMIALRAVVTKDFMTSRPYQMPWDILQRVQARIVNEVKGVNRVLYDISTKPPATIEFE